MKMITIKSARLFLLYFKNQVNKKKKVSSLIILISFVFASKLILVQNWNTVSIHEIGKHPILYTVNSAECFYNETLINTFQDEKFISEYIDGFATLINLKIKVETPRNNTNSPL